jgi:hypothetical protein
MATFLDTTEGYLNVDHIVLVRPGPAAGDEVLIQMADGRTYVCHVVDLTPIHSPTPLADPAPPPAYAPGGDYTVPGFRKEVPYVAPVPAAEADT